MAEVDRKALVDHKGACCAYGACCVDWYTAVAQAAHTVVALERMAAVHRPAKELAQAEPEDVAVHKLARSRHPAFASLATESPLNSEFLSIVSIMRIYRFVLSELFHMVRCS